MDNIQNTNNTSSMASGSTGQPEPSGSKSGGVQSERDSKGGKDGPQIRSRITVVCGECKRLKLKCDRKAPCGSCVKRETTERCIYSQQATEKVDLQSLNNRVMSVELAFLRVLNGLPANYVPTHPAVIEEAIKEGINIPVLSSTIAPASSASSSDRAMPLYTMEPLQSAVDTHGTCSQPHRHHHHLASPMPNHLGHSNLSAVELTQQKVTMLRQQLLLECQPEPRLQDATDANYALKMEPDTYAPTPEDDIVMMSSGSSSMLPSPFRSTPPSSSTSPSTLKLTKAAPRATVGALTRPRAPTHALPSLNIYFEGAFVSSPASSHGSGVLSSSAAPLYWGDAPGPSHLARQAVPTSSTPRSSQSRRGSQASLMVPPPSPVTSFGSKPAVTNALRSALPGASSCSRFLKAAIEVLEVRPIELGLSLRPINGRSAWDAFEDRCKGVYPANSHTVPGSAADETLSFFSLVCALLAVGAARLGSDPRQGKVGDPSEAGAFLFALSQQALDIWYQSGQRDDSGISGELDEAVKEERAEYVRACVVQLLYLLGSTEGPLTALKVASVGDTKKDALLNNVKNMVDALTRWGLDKALALPVFDAVPLAEESRRRLYWDVLFYDLFISDALGAPRSAPTSFYKAPLPSLDSQVHDDAMPDAMDDGRLAVEAVTGHTQQSSRSRSERLYLTLRAQLTQLDHDVKLRIVTPDCCCGYTLDQAIGMWGEVQHWTKSIPVDFAYPFELGSKASVLGEELEPHSGVDVDTRNRDSWLRKILGCELALATQTLLIQIFVTFAPLLVGKPLEGTHQTVKQLQSVLRELVGASQATIHIASFLKDLLKRGEPSVVGLENPPIILSFYALDDIVLNATIICSRMCFQPRSTPASSLTQTLGLSGGGQAGIELLQNIGLGLDFLDTLPEGRLPGERRAKDAFLVDALRTRWREHKAILNTRPIPLKRKRNLSDREPLTSPRASPGETHTDTTDRMDDTPSGYGASNLGRSGSSRHSPSSGIRPEHLPPSRSHTTAERLRRFSSNAASPITPELIAAAIASKNPSSAEPPKMRTIIATLDKSSKPSKSKAIKPVNNNAVGIRVRPNKMGAPGAPVIPPVVYTSVASELATYNKAASAPKSSSAKKSPPVDSSKRATRYSNEARSLNTDVPAATPPPPPAPSSTGVSQLAYYHQRGADLAERSRSNSFSHTAQNDLVSSMASMYTPEPRMATDPGPMNLSLAHMQYPAPDDGSKYLRRHSIAAASVYGALQTAEAAPMYGGPMAPHPYPYPQGFSYDRPLNSGELQQDPPPDSGGRGQHSAGLTQHTSSPPIFQIPEHIAEGPMATHDTYYSSTTTAGPENSRMYEAAVSYEQQQPMEMGHSQPHPSGPYQPAEFYSNVPSNMTGLETWSMGPSSAAHGNVTEQPSQPWNSNPNPAAWS